MASTSPEYGLIKADTLNPSFRVATAERSGSLCNWISETLLLGSCLLTMSIN